MKSNNTVNYNKKKKKRIGKNSKSKNISKKNMMMRKMKMKIMRTIMRMIIKEKTNLKPPITNPINKLLNLCSSKNLLLLLHNTRFHQQFNNIKFLR